MRFRLPFRSAVQLPLFLALVSAPFDSARAAVVERIRYLMGTSLSLTLVGDDPPALDRAAAAAFAEVARLEGVLSNWSEASEVSELNRAAGRGARVVHGDLYAVLESGLSWAERTGGAFDPALEPLVRAYDLRGEGRWPDAAALAGARAASGWRRVRLDPPTRTATLESGAGIETGGIGKGYALDRAAGVLSSQGVEAALLDLGGQVLAMGAPPGEDGWRVLVADPRDRNRPVAAVVLRDASLSTSGQSERSLPTERGPVGHILDPRTGKPAPAWGSVSAVAATATDADALSTALFVLGPEDAGSWVASRAAHGEAPVAALLLRGGGPGEAPGLVVAGAHPGLLSVSAAAAEDPTAGSAGSPPTNEELARRLDILAEEIEDMRIGAAAGEPESRYGLGPAASRVYGSSPGISIGGYGEALFEHVAAEDESGAPTGALDRVDLLRLVSYLGYKFSERVLLNSEVEIEHATTGEGAEEKGEISVEFSYLDFLLHRRANVRAGLILSPLGWINELHEPPIFLGARRPDVERVVLPTTWRGAGVGLFGELGAGVSYRAYLMEGLRAVGDDDAGIDGFTASSGLRGGRQSGSLARAEQWALAARADWKSAHGVTVGASLFTGNSAQGDTTPSGASFGGRVTALDAHAEYRAHGAWLRGLCARVDVDDVAAINEANGLAGSASAGSRIDGWYVEAAYDLWRHIRPESALALLPYVRYERFDTQAEVPAGFARNPANERRVMTLGALFQPHPQVAVKADYQVRRNEAETGADQIGLALGFLF